MKTEKNCKIVQDLLPNYVEKLTNEETNIFIEEHLKSCHDCTNILSNMQKDLNVLNTNKGTREVKYIKKYNNRLNTLKIIILIIFLLIIIISSKKIAIISNLYNKAEITRMTTNYHEISYSYNFGNYIKEETFKLDDKKKIIITQLTEDGNVSTTTMFATKTSNQNNADMYSVNLYSNSPNEKKAILNTNMELYDDLQNSFYTENLWYLFKYSMLSSITTATFNGTKCYYISNFRNPYSYSFGGMYVNKETGFPISTMSYEDKNAEHEPTREFILELNTVKESDFVEPDITEYNVQQ